MNRQHEEATATTFPTPNGTTGGARSESAAASPDALVRGGQALAPRDAGGSLGVLSEGSPPPTAGGPAWHTRIPNQLTGGQARPEGCDGTVSMGSHLLDARD